MAINMTTHTEGLKPCPFCGGEPYFERLGDPRQSCILVCGNCGCRHESSDEGVENGTSWNDRPVQASEAAIRNAIQLLETEASNDVQDNTPGNECCGLYGDGLRRAIAVLSALSTTPAEPVAQPQVLSFVGRVFVDQLTGERTVVLNKGAANLPDMCSVYVSARTAASTIQPKE
jgi:Lar family restriction alleviation protein